MNPDGTGARVGPPTSHESQWLLSDTDLASQYPLGAQAGDEDTDTDTDTPPSLATVVPGSSGEPLSGTGEWSWETGGWGVWGVWGVWVGERS
jgi:hypothetical protein